MTSDQFTNLTDGISRLQLMHWVVLVFAGIIAAMMYSFHLERERDHGRTTDSVNRIVERLDQIEAELIKRPD